MAFDLDAFLEKTYGFDEVTWARARDWLTHRLRELAHEGKTGYYGEIVSEMRKAIGITFDPHGTPLAALLGQINVTEHDDERPLLSAVVLSKDGGRPGVGFWNISRDMGIKCGDSDVEREEFWLTSLQACYRYWSTRRP